MRFIFVSLSSWGEDSQGHRQTAADARLPYKIRFLASEKMEM